MKRRLMLWLYRLAALGLALGPAMGFAQTQYCQPGVACTAKSFKATAGGFCFSDGGCLSASSAPYDGGSTQYLAASLIDGGSLALTTDLTSTGGTGVFRWVMPNSAGSTRRFLLEQADGDDVLAVDDNGSMLLNPSGGTNNNANYVVYESGGFRGCYNVSCQYGFSWAHTVPGGSAEGDVFFGMMNGLGVWRQVARFLATSRASHWQGSVVADGGLIVSTGDLEVRQGSASVGGHTDTARFGVRSSGTGTEVIANFENSSGGDKLQLLSNGNVLLDRTDNTASTGSFTCNKALCKGKIANGAGTGGLSLVVTNSLVTSSSAVLCSINSGGVKGIGCQPGSGNVIVSLEAAASGDTEFTLLVLNPTP